LSWPVFSNKAHWLGLPAGPDGEVRTCVRCALWLVEEDGQRSAMLLGRKPVHGLGDGGSRLRRLAATPPRRARRWPTFAASRSNTASIEAKSWAWALNCSVESVYGRVCQGRSASTSSNGRDIGDVIRRVPMVLTRGRASQIRRNQVRKQSESCTRHKASIRFFYSRLEEGLIVERSGG
jgi:hypothetical protein